MRFICILLVMVFFFAIGSVSAQDQTPRLRPLDFSPFEEVLMGFTDERAAEIGTLVFSATSIIDVQVAVQSGEFSYEELTLWFLDRIQRYDETLRTYVELNPNALEEARAADALLAQGTVLSALHGIPVNLKDNIDTTAPMHTTGGAEILLNNTPAADAPLVTQLRAAGAVILGKAGLSEFAGGIDLFHPGFNAVGGQVVNPHGAQFSPSGSSAGSGASTAAYLTMVSVGSETAGSLIAPASWNGVVGMYPGDGLVDSTGVIPLIANNDSAGPIGRTVTDVAILLGEIDNTDVDYVASLDVDSLNSVQVGVLAGGILTRITIVDPNGLEDFSDNEAVLDLAAEALEGLGASPVPLTGWSGEGAPTVDAALGILINGGIRHDMMGYLASVGAPATTVEELQAYNLAEPETRIPFGQGVLDGAVADTALADPAEYESAAAGLRGFAVEALETTFTETGVDVLVTFNNYESAIYATANYPAITVPLGLRVNGMPVGLTMIGKVGSEAQLLSYAYAFEQATRLRVNPIFD